MFNHTRQLLLEDEFLENYFVIFGKQDSNEVKDISSKQPERTSENDSLAKLYRKMHSEV